MDLLIPLLLIVVSILAIGKGSDWLTDSLIPIARKLGVSRSFVGLILVSVTVSLPEILVAVSTTLKGYSDISLGVVLGSIVCNIGLMTGLSATVKPLKVSSRIVLRDGIFSIIIPILVFAVSAGGQITRIEGFAFLLLFIPYAINVYLIERISTKKEKSKHLKEVATELELAGFEFGKIRLGWLSFGIGSVLLLVSTQLFSDQLITLVKIFGIDELLLGLTIGAVGPSIPNIITAYQATKKGLGEIAVSETLGSNIFTLLVTVGILAMLTPIKISPLWLYFDLPAMIFMSFLLFYFIFTHKTITKKEGWLLMLAYFAIIVIQLIIR